ncbi:hypothetical protein MK489_14300 [Myxococcota bacterium]|nr:hypothetical protein [Myxococcota bacterium]
MNARWTRKAVALFLFLGLSLGTPVPNLELAGAGPAHASPPALIDVLVVYPQSAEDHLSRLITWGRTFGETEMGAFLEVNFGYVNQIYQNSGIDVGLEVVHHQEIDLSYIDSNWAVTLSYALMNSELGTAAYVPYLEAIETLRDLHQADIVIYWRDFQDGGPTRNGAGSIGGGEDEAYVHLTYGGINPPVVAHESAHLLGAQHSDGVQEQASFSIDGDPPLNREYRTVMTIAVPFAGLDAYRYVWRFSNRGTSVSGDVDCSPLTGSLETCNFTSTASLGDATRDAAATISAYAPVVAAFRGSNNVPVLPPGGLGFTALLLSIGALYRLTRPSH